MIFGLRFDFRNPPLAGTTMTDRYAAALDMAQWADRLGCISIAVSEHHGSPDGYLPSPIPMVAAMAARTSSVRFTIAALIAPFYDPAPLGRGSHRARQLEPGTGRCRHCRWLRRRRVRHVRRANGSQRGRLVTEAVATLKAAFRGESFDYHGRKVQITPPPFLPSGPGILLGGSSEAAARRAARIADGFIPSLPGSVGFLSR